MTDADVDELFDVKTLLYIGNYQNCINEAQSIKNLSQSSRLECQCLLYRAYIAQKKYRIVMNEVTTASHPQLRAIRMFAEYLSGDRLQKDGVLESLEKQVTAGVDADTSMFFLMAAAIYLHENNFESALRILNQIETLERFMGNIPVINSSDAINDLYIALMLQIYLVIDRVDLGKKELVKLQEYDEDATITQLAQAWFYLTVGGDKLQDAYFIFQEMADKHTPSPFLLNGMAVSLIAQNRTKEADSLLHEALSKDNDNAETIANLATVSQLLSKPQEISQRYVCQLMHGEVQHPFVVGMLNKENEFDRLAKNYSPLVL